MKMLRHVGLTLKIALTTSILLCSPSLAGETSSKTTSTTALRSFEAPLSGTIEIPIPGIISTTVLESIKVSFDGTTSTNVLEVAEASFSGIIPTAALENVLEISPNQESSQAVQLMLF